MAELPGDLNLFHQFSQTAEPISQGEMDAAVVASSLHFCVSVVERVVFVENCQYLAYPPNLLLTQPFHISAPVDLGEKG